MSMRVQINADERETVLSGGSEKGTAGSPYGFCRPPSFFGATFNIPPIRLSGGRELTLCARTGVIKEALDRLVRIAESPADANPPDLLIATRFAGILLRDSSEKGLSSRRVGYVYTKYQK